MDLENQSRRSIRRTKWLLIATGSGCARERVEVFQKDNKALTRRLAADRDYTRADGAH